MSDMSSEWVLDQTKEIFNLGITSAAHEISELVGERVELSIPIVRFDTLSSIMEEMGGKDRQVSSVLHKFQGQLQGRGFLLIDHSSSMKLIRFLLQEELDYGYLTESEKDAIIDLSTEIINGVLMALSGELSLTLSSKLPKYLEGKLGSVLNNMIQVSESADDKYLFVCIAINTPERGLVSEMVFVQRESDFEKLAVPLRQSMRKS